jgi:hypothetical protein
MMAWDWSRQRRLAASMIAAVVACAIPQIASAETVPLPSGAASGGALYDSIYGMTCQSAGVCTAVGWYEDTSTNEQAVIETETGYSWTAQKVNLTALPGGVYSDPYAQLDGVSCSSVGNCAAVGDYNDASNHAQGLIETETNGTWTTSRLPLTGLPNTAADPGVDLTSVSCPSATSCVAVGSYDDSAGRQQALIATGNAGTWTAQKVSLSSFSTYTNPYGQLTQVSCASPGSCVAVGSFRDSADNDEGLIETESGGSWSSSRPDLSHLGNASGAPEGEVTAVSCPSGGNCTAVGFYLDNSTGGGSDQGMLLQQTGGSWGPATEARLPSNANATASAQFADLYSVSCAATGDCTAVGSYDATTSSYVEAYAVTETGGSWSAGTEINLPQDAATNPKAYAASVSCAAPGSCVAAGTYDNGSSHYDALVAQQSGGTWTTAGVAQTNSPGLFSIGYASVSCTTTGYCAVGGGTLGFSAPSTNDIAFLFDPSAAVSAPSATVSGTGAQVTWTAPGDTGGLPVSGYTVTANDLTNASRGGQTVSGGTSGGANVAGLSPEDTYTFTVTPLTLLGSGRQATTASVAVPPSKQQISASLAGLLAPKPPADRLKKLARAHAYTFIYKPLESGKVTVRWYETTGHGKHKHKHLFASGSAATTGATPVKVHVALTGFGRRAVKAGHKLHLSATVTFVGGGMTVTRTRNFTLR